MSSAYASEREVPRSQRPILYPHPLTPYPTPSLRPDSRHKQQNQLDDRVCVSCGLRKQKGQYSKRQWKKEDRKCQDCIFLLNSGNSSKEFVCNSCKKSRKAIQFSRDVFSAKIRVCRPCQFGVLCSRCNEKKYRKEFDEEQLSKAVRICHHCLNSHLCQECNLRKLHEEFFPSDEKGGKITCRSCWNCPLCHSCNRRRLRKYFRGNELVSGSRGGWRECKDCNKNEGKRKELAAAWNGPLGGDGFPTKIIQKMIRLWPQFHEKTPGELRKLKEEHLPSTRNRKRALERLCIVTPSWMCDDFSDAIDKVNISLWLSDRPITGSVAVKQSSKLAMILHKCNAMGTIHVDLGPADNEWKYAEVMQEVCEFSKRLPMNDSVGSLIRSPEPSAGEIGDVSDEADKKGGNEIIEVSEVARRDKDHIDKSSSAKRELENDDAKEGQPYAKKPKTTSVDVRRATASPFPDDDGKDSKDIADLHHRNRCTIAPPVSASTENDSGNGVKVVEDAAAPVSTLREQSPAQLPSGLVEPRTRLATVLMKTSSDDASAKMMADAAIAAMSQQDATSRECDKGGSSSGLSNLLEGYEPSSSEHSHAVLNSSCSGGQTNSKSSPDTVSSQEVLTPSDLKGDLAYRSDATKPILICPQKHDTQVKAEKVTNHDVFMDRFLAFRQYVELLRQTAPRTSHTRNWKITLRRSSLCRDLLNHFKKAKRVNMYQTTEVSFIDIHGNKEEGIDASGLTIEMFTVFFQQIASQSDLFEHMPGADGAPLPKASASEEDMIAFGRILCKCVIDDVPVGLNTGPALLEILSGIDGRRSFKNAEEALLSLHYYDPCLSDMWRRMMDGSVSLEGTEAQSFDSSQNDGIRVSTGNIQSLIIAGVKQRLKLCRLESWSAMKRGFEEHIYLQIQLAPFATNELLYMVHGRDELTIDDIHSSIEWPSTNEKESIDAGFEAAGCSNVPMDFEAIILDANVFDRMRRQQFLEWCTARSVLPCNGLPQKIRLRLHLGVDDGALPTTHTCTREIFLPLYKSRKQLQECLFVALDHRWDGYYQE